MPQLPPYVRYWADKMWADLPERTTPIIAAALKHWDDWHALVRGRVEEVASSVASLDSATSQTLVTKADKTTTITAGSGLDGGGDLSSPRTLSVEWGTGHEQVRRGDDRGIVAAQALPDTVSEGDLLVGRADGTLDKLPRTLPGLILGSGSTSPKWVEPGSAGLGLPPATGAGCILVSKADGTWETLPPPVLGEQVLQADLTSPLRVSWGTTSAIEKSDEVFYALNIESPQLAMNASPSTWATRLANTVTISSPLILTTGYSTRLPFAVDAWYRLVTLPPSMRPLTEVIKSTGSVSVYPISTNDNSAPSTTARSAPLSIRIETSGDLSLKFGANGYAPYYRISTSANPAPTNMNISDAPSYNRTT